MQKYRPKRLSSKKKRVGEFVVDETLLKIGRVGMALMGGN
jgi:hypothetical protein